MAVDHGDSVARCGEVTGRGSRLCRTFAAACALAGFLALAGCGQANASLPPLPVPKPSYLPPGAQLLGKPSGRPGAGRLGWVLFYKFPGRPAPDPNYSNRWLSVGDVTGRVLPKLSGQAWRAGHEHPAVTEVPHRTRLFGHPAMVYTSPSPGGEILVEWLANDIVTSVSTCKSCALSMKGIIRVASSLGS